MLWTSIIYFSTYFLIETFIQICILHADCISLNNGRVEANEYRSVVSCIAKISEKELFWKPTVALKISDNETKNEKDFNNELLEQLTKIEMPYVAINTNGALDISEASFLSVSYFEDCEALTAFDFYAIKKDIKYLVVLDSYSDVCRQHFKGIEIIIAEYDISFYIKNSEGQYDLYTYIPDVDSETCKVVINKPLKLNTCFNGRLTRFIAFPGKVSTNLNKCPFKVGLGSLYPFTTIENKSSLQTYDPLEMDRVKGMDFEIIKILTESFNGTLDLYYIYKEEENPYANMDFLAFVINGSLEACAGGFYRIYGDVVAYSGIYARQTIMWIYSAERVTRTWDNMVVSIDGLYLFIIFYFSYSVVWCSICLFDKHAVSLMDTLLYSWGALVGTASLQDAKSLKQKILNIVYLNMCLHLSVYISIQLFSFLTIRGPPQMFKTNDDIMDSGRTAFLRPVAKYFIKEENYEHFANTSKECTSFVNCAELSLLFKGVTVYMQGYFYPFQAATAVNDEARMLRTDENLITVYYEMIIRKDSPLVLKYRRITGWLFEAGITEKLYNEAIGLTIVGKAKIATKTMVASSYACQAGCKLSVEQFSGVFFVWSFGCVASCCLFIMEILSKKSVASIKTF